jgi:salicylate hydroxylase
MVTTTSGATYSGDVLIAADGIKSVLREHVVGADFHSQPSGHSAYRSLVPMAKITSNPRLAPLDMTVPRITIVNGGDRRIICYPTRDGKLLNYVAALREFSDKCREAHLIFQLIRN